MLLWMWAGSSCFLSSGDGYVGDHARILTGFDQQNIQGLVGLSFFLGELPFLGHFKLHINEVVRVQNMISGAPLIVYLCSASWAVSA